MSGFTFGGGAQPSGFGTATTSAPAFGGFGTSATPSTGKKRNFEVRITMTKEPSFEQTIISKIYLTSRLKQTT